MTNFSSSQLDIVEFAGGVWQGLWKHTTKTSANDLVLTCKEDSQVSSSPSKKGKKRGGATQDAKKLPDRAFDVELLLTGLLQKKLDFKAHAVPKKKA